MPRSSTLATDLDYVMRWVERMGDTNGGVPIHAPTRGPRLSIVHRPEGEMGAIHDHGTWVAISPIVGLETHRRYRIRGDGASARPEVAETLYLEPTQMATLLPPDDIHDHGHLSGHGTPAYVLIMTGDDQTRVHAQRVGSRHGAASAPAAGRRRPLAGEPADAPRLSSISRAHRRRGRGRRRNAPRGTSAIRAPPRG